MNRREWIRSILIIGVLLLIVALVAQSRRECEIPGSSLVPCFFNPTKIHEQKGALRMPRHFPSPWTVEEIPGGYKVKDANGQSLAYVYGRETGADADIASVLTMDEARRIASNIAKLPALLGADK